MFHANEISEIALRHPHFKTHPVAVAEDFYLGSNSFSEIDDAERFNHSCDPNLGIQGQIVVLSRRAIAAGEELTFDYETTDFDPGGFECRCGAEDCRGLIDGSAWKSPEFQVKNREWLSWHVAQRIASINQKV